MNNVIIIGSGVHAQTIAAEITLLKKFKLLGFFDEKKKIGEIIVDINKKYKVIGKLNKCSFKKFKNTNYIIGIGNRKIREKIVKNNKLKWISIISKNAIINKNVTIKEGSYIASGCIVNFGTTIGEHVILNTNSTIEHHNKIGDFCNIGPGTTTGGSVLIKNNVEIGMCSSILNNIVVSKKCIIGAGSLVIKNCKSNSLYYGSPAKYIGKIDLIKY